MGAARAVVVAAVTVLAIANIGLADRHIDGRQMVGIFGRSLGAIAAVTFLYITT